jgi:hypothetical protein
MLLKLNLSFKSFSLTIVGLFSAFLLKAQVPTITGFSPASGAVGTTVTITGTNFNTTLASNAVFFGQSRAAVVSATATSLSVTVPSGASAAPVTVINTATGLQVNSTVSFRPVYSPSKGLITGADMAPKADFAVGAEPYGLAVGDIDGDNKLDMVTVNSNANTMSVFRNTSSGGTVSFATRQDFSGLTQPFRVAIADLNGDGKLDVVVSNNGWPANSISVFRNTSTVGTISFAARQDFAAGGAPYGIAVGDLNRDGKPEVAVANNSDNTISIFRNNSTTAAIAFGTKQDVAVSSGPQSVVIADLTNDGWPDLAASTYNSNTISIRRSTSTTSTISFGALVDLDGGGNYTQCLAVADLNNDNLPDLILGRELNYSGNVGVFRNTTVSNSLSFATRQDFSTEWGPPSSIKIGDIDGDGMPDIATGSPIAGYSNDISVLRNASSGGSISFNKVAIFGVSTNGYAVYDFAIGDVSGDGRPDIVATNWNSKAVSILRNNPCFPTAGTIGNGHVIPNPAERSFDSVLNVTLDQPLTFNGQTFGSYRWEQSINNTDWVPAKTNTTAPSYRFEQDSLKGTTYYRRASNACFGPTVYSNVVTIKVQQPTGIIKGRVTSKLGTPVGGVTIEAQKTGSLDGSPQTYVYKATTDEFGDYTIPKIFFGDENDGSVSTNFIIRPATPGRFFNPASRNRTFLVSDKSFTEVDFVDTTVFSITGRVYQECLNCLVNGQVVPVVQGAVDSVSIFVDNKTIRSGVTGFIDPPGEYGRYGLTVTEPKTYKIEPKLTGRVFVPAFQNVSVSQNVANIDFKDNTSYTISGKLTAGCNDNIGQAELEFYDIPDGFPTRQPVFRKRVTSDSTGDYQITLPARKYRVQINSLFNGTDVSYAALSTFFNALPADSITVDISTGDKTFNLVYNRPPTIEITGLEPVCGLPTAVMVQGESRLIPIKVWQGPKTKGCPAFDSTLTIITNIQRDDDNETLSFKTTNGVAAVTLTGGAPNIVAPYYKSLSVNYRDRVGAQANTTTNVVVTGLRQNGQTFTTVSPQVPIMVLHDPPGDASSAFWETSQTNETAMRMYSADSDEKEGWAEVKLGQKYEAGSIFVSSEFSFWGKVKASLNVGARVSKASEAIITTTTTKKFATSSNGDVIGDQSDVFIGAAFNFRYGIANEVYYNFDSCKTGLRKKLIMATDTIATEYIFSEYHIRNTLIPQLISQRQFYLNQPQKLDSLNNQIRVWQQVLANNDANKARAAFIKNVSFDANQDAIQESTTTTATKSSTIEFDMNINGELAVEIGAEVGGSGASGGVNLRFKMEEGGSTINTSMNSTTFGYSLDDDDVGDFYSVNIKRDPVYNSPVFELVAGRTSCPVEENTQPRDNFRLLVDQPIVSGVDPNGEATFLLRIQNTSESDEQRTYLLTLNQTTNVGGAIVKINGTQTFPVPFAIAYPGEAIITVTVSRSPGSNVFAWEGLQFIATDNCGGTISKTVSVSAFFNTTCSAVTLASPENGWLSNSQSNNVVPVIARGYNLANLSTLSLEYAKVGSNTWVNVASRTAADLAGSPTLAGFDWNTTSVTDGNYNLRMRVNCPAGITYSQRAAGVIDRTPPLPLGKPEPTDDRWAMDKQISITYNEVLDVNNISISNLQFVRLSNNQAIPFTVTGFSNKLIVSPAVDLSLYPNERFRIKLNNIPDYYGNVRTSVDSIGFTVVSRTPSSSNKAISLDIRNPTQIEKLSPPPGEIGTGTPNTLPFNSGQTLAAGDSTINFYFRLPQPAANLTRVNFAVSGTAVFGKDFLVIFDSVALDDKGKPSLANTFNGTTGSIMIKQGERFAILRIDPIDNSINNTNKTVIVTILEGGDYDNGQTLVQQGTIVNEDAKNTYEFIGTGLFTISSNWRYNAVPPIVLPSGDTIIINPAASECILNVPLTLQNGSSLIVNPGKQLRERK